VSLVKRPDNFFLEDPIEFGQVHDHGGSGVDRAAYGNGAAIYMAVSGLPSERPESTLVLLWCPVGPEVPVGRGELDCPGERNGHV
jgi:hypothetical protein